MTIELSEDLGAVLRQQAEQWDMTPQQLATWLLGNELGKIGEEQTFESMYPTAHVADSSPLREQMIEDSRHLHEIIGDGRGES